MTTPRVGRLAIVLHSHVPWVLGHGIWPVGEEWLRQAWAHAYIPVVAMLRERAEQGRKDLLTLGVTPVLAAQWDSAASITEQERWIADWATRAAGKGLSAQAAGDAIAAQDATRHFRAAKAAMEEFSNHWHGGGSAAIRPLVDSGAVELLGGPATHAFTPHLLEPIADLALASGLADTTVRTGTRPQGIWAPECAYAPGLEEHYQRHGIGHFVIDGPTLPSRHHSLHRPYLVGDTQVVAFARDLDVTYRVWSPRSGYPGNRWYQDFHSYDHEWGLHSSRVTRRTSGSKAPYDQQRALEQVRIDADDFLDAARTRMVESNEADPILVVAYDTELFGHWWHEGPQFLATVLDSAHSYGIQTTTLAAASQQATERVDLPAGTWGSGKDSRVWEDGEAGTLRDRGRAASYAVLDHLRRLPDDRQLTRQPTGDAIVTELLLALASDWAFMITKDSAAQYARGRSHDHFTRLAEMLRAVHHDPAATFSDDRLPFIDSRRLGS